MTLPACLARSDGTIPAMIHQTDKASREPRGSGQDSW